MHYIFSIEGNIGSGKSTLVKRLKKHFNFLKKVKNSIFTRTCWCLGKYKR